jgi:hypothetical protein
VNGVATFSTLNDTVAGDYTLRASASGLTAAVSTPYTITAGVAAQPRFLDQPSNAVAGAFFAPVVRVAVADVYGNTVPTATNSITLTGNSFGTCIGDAWRLKLTFSFGGAGLPHCYLFVGPLSAPVGGTLTVAASNGVATFSDLRPRFTEVFQVTASGTGLASVNSASFVVAPSVAHAVWAKVPGALNEATPPPQVANRTFAVAAYLVDSLRNQVDAGSNIISLGIGSNPSSGTLTVANNIAAVAGRADFTVSINNAGNGYRLSGSTAGLSIIPSDAFNVAAFGTASRLGFTVQPTNSTVGAAIAPSVQVCVQDGVGNTVTSGSNSITIAIGTNPGSATLGGTTTVAAVSGCATFANLTLSAAASGYALTASATSLTAATSSTFSITP